MFGTQAYNGDFHLSGYTELLLCDELFRAGFGDVEMELRDEWLWEVEATAGGSPLGLVWGPGFHRRESAAGPAGPPKSAELCLCLGGERRRRSPSRSRCRGIRTRTRRCRSRAAASSSASSSRSSPASTRWRSTLQPGATRLTLTTEGRPADDGRTSPSEPAVRPRSLR